MYLYFFFVIFNTLSEIFTIVKLRHIFFSFLYLDEIKLIKQNVILCLS